METLAAVTGVTLILTGCALFVAPVAVDQTVSTNISPGNWTAIDIPMQSSISGAQVEVDLHWGDPIPCGGFCGGPSRELSNRPAPSFLVVIDCGAGSCPPPANTSIESESQVSNIQAYTSFSATPGHQYMLWAYREHWPGENWTTPVPVAWTLLTPPLGGFFGLSIGALGGILIVHSYRRLWPLPKPEHQVY